jgi:gliding motility-associated-like protein
MRREIEARDRAKSEIHVILIFILLSMLGKHMVGQNPACTPNVPYFYVNLSSNPNAVWTSSSVVRQGQCCGAAASTDCISFDVVLHPSAAGIQIDMLGADPAGSLFYQIGCTGNYPGGTVKCINGVGPHQITFCKPGGNANVYQITSIAKPTFPPNDTVRLGCKQKMISYGVANGSVTWQSISPGVPGQYNSYLDSTNVASPTYSPGPGAPPYVDYLVCGMPIATMCGYTNTVCDTVRFYNFGSLTASVTPNPASFCSTGLGSGVIVGASVSGGQAPYTYLWSNGTGTLATTNSYFATATGNYSVEIRDMLYNANTCPASIQTVAVNQGTVPVVNAGTDQTVCVTASSFNLNGNVQFAGGGVWSGGSGSFSPSNSALNASYAPSASEIAAGFVTLSLTSTAAGASCPNQTDAVTIYFYNISGSAMVSSNYNGADISCKGLSDGSATAGVTGGVGPFTYTWSTSPVQNSATASNLSSGTYVVTIADANNCMATANVTLTEPTALVATAALTQSVSCAGGSDGSASVSESGGTPGYTYMWSTTPVQTTSSASGLSAGAYSVVVSDANGCKTTANITLNAATALNAVANVASSYSGQDISCYGMNDGVASVNVTGGAGGYSYSWNTLPVQNTMSAVNLGAGTYVVTITDANGCAGTATVTLNDPPPLLPLAITQSVSCAGGNNGSATITQSGGTPGYSYQWSTTPVQTSALATGLSAGSYNVLVTDANGCSAASLVNVVEPSAVQVSINTLSYYNGYHISCNGSSDGMVDITVNGGVGGYSYSWSNGSNTEDINSVGAGAYNVVVTDANGCTNTLNVSLIQPTKLNATIDYLSLYDIYNVSCNGYKDGAIFVLVNGGTGNYSYSWSNGANTQDITGVGAGSYALNVMDQNGCITSLNATLLEPTPVLASYTTQKPSCHGLQDGAISLLAGGGTAPYSYNWSNGVTSSDNLNLGAGSYTVVATDNNGCASEMVIKLSEPDVLMIDKITQNLKCYMDSTGEVSCLPIGGTAPYSYSWSTGAATQNISTLLAGTYMVNVTDAHGCAASETVEVRQPEQLKVSLTSPTQFNGFNVSMHNGTDGSILVGVSGGSSPFNFDWSNHSTIKDQLNLGSGTFTVLCTDANGCRTAGNITLTAPLDLEMPTGFSPNGDASNDMFVVHGIEAYPSNYLTVFNRWGNIVYSTAMYDNSWNGTNMEGEALPDATYFVLLEINGQEKVLKGYVEIRR